jgi:hypothetical protein
MMMVMAAGLLLRWDVVVIGGSSLSSVSRVCSLCLRRVGVNLYKGPFTKVARFDVAKAVVIDMGADTGGFCPYGCPLSLLEVSNASPLTLEY